MRFSSIGGVVTRLGRVTTAFAVALIVMLAIGSVSPETHERLCHHHAGDGDAAHCVITAFAAGEAYSVPLPAVSVPTHVGVTTVRQPEVRRELAMIEHRLQPSCGPPLACPLA